MKLADGDLLRLLPPHIYEDEQLAATGNALNPVLAEIVRAIPNQLIYARLGGQKPETFLPPLRRLTEARGGLRPLSIDELEALAWQFHVDFREVAKTREQLAELVLRSIAWHRIKGTPRSMYDALILCGFGTRRDATGDSHDYGIFIEEGGSQVHWATYQLGFEEIADFDDLKAIVRICREMQPTRCRLWRVYTFDYDMRPGVWSGPLPQNAWSNAWWSVWSGSYMPDIPGLDERGLLVSWGRRHTVLCEGWSENRKIAAFQEKLRVYRVFLRAFPRWSESWWSREVYSKPAAFILLGEFAGLIGRLIGGTPWPGEIWPDAIWPDSSWPGEPWPEQNWGGWIHNFAGECDFMVWDWRVAPVLPPDFYQTWPESDWRGDSWDAAFHNLRPEIRAGSWASLNVYTDSRPRLQYWQKTFWRNRPWLEPEIVWQNRSWPAQPWFDPKTVALNPHFTIFSEILPSAWLDCGWPQCAWQTKPLEEQ